MDNTAILKMDIGVRSPMTHQWEGISWGLLGLWSEARTSGQQELRYRYHLERERIADPKVGNLKNMLGNDRNIPACDLIFLLHSRCILGVHFEVSSRVPLILLGPGIYRPQSTKKSAFRASYPCSELPNPVPRNTQVQIRAQRPHKHKDPTSLVLRPQTRRIPAHKAT